MAARIVGRLKARQVVNARPRKGRRAVVLGDGGNLYLEVTRGAYDNICRSWLFKYEIFGKRREMGLGPLHTVSLAEVRASARTLRQQLLNGIDPLTEKQKARQAQAAERAKIITFKQVADLYVDAHGDGWSRKHRALWQSSLGQYVLPRIGSMSVADVDTGSVMRCIEPLWKTKTETASRLRARIESVLGYATTHGWRSGDNPARWRDHLENLLPGRAKVQPVEHHGAMPYAELPGFIAELRGHEGVIPRALEFCILTACRTEEVMGADWNEIDLKAKTWTRPAERMKGGKEHRVPLSDAALQILQSFGHRDGRVFPRSLDLMRRLLLRMRPGTGFVVHGFRSSFRDWCAERTHYPNEVAEQALAHTINSAVEKAYRRGDLFEKRRKLMDAWASFCAKPPVAEKKGVLVQLHEAGRP